MQLQTAATLIVTYKYFRGTLATWDELFAEAAEFATRLGRERLIGISQSQWGADGIVAVWYWDERGNPADETSMPTPPTPESSFFET